MHQKGSDAPKFNESMEWKKIIHASWKKFDTQVLPSDPFGDFKWPFQGLSDLHLGYQKVIGKKLDCELSKYFGCFGFMWNTFPGLGNVYTTV